jgi:hypothetical protein
MQYGVETRVTDVARRQFTMYMHLQEEVIDIEPNNERNDHSMEWNKSSAAGHNEVSYIGTRYATTKENIDSHGIESLRY